MYKCDRCYARVADGELPACIEACPEDVQTIGPRDEILRKAHALAREINGYIYGEKENGGTNTIYVSPVPFEELKNRWKIPWPRPITWRPPCSSPRWPELRPRSENTLIGQKQ